MHCTGLDDSIKWSLFFSLWLPDYQLNKNNSLSTEPYKRHVKHGNHSIDRRPDASVPPNRNTHPSPDSENTMKQLSAHKLKYAARLRFVFDRKCVRIGINGGEWIDSVFVQRPSDYMNTDYLWMRQGIRKNYWLFTTAATSNTTRELLQINSGSVIRNT